MSDAMRFCLGLSSAVGIVFGCTCLGAYLSNDNVLVTSISCIVGFMVGIFTMIQIIEED